MNLTFQGELDETGFLLCLASWDDSKARGAATLPRSHVGLGSH